MNASQWTHVKETFHRALEQDASRRAEFVVVACGGDTEVQAEIERLLAAHHGAHGFLESHPGTWANNGRLSGQRLGRYEVGRLVGVGGMGEVYAARDLDLGREVAIKTARADGGSGSRLRGEAQQASRLNHPHICTIYEVGSVDGHTYIAMEYVAGNCLRDIVPPAGLPLDDVVRFGTSDCGRDCACPPSRHRPS